MFIVSSSVFDIIDLQIDFMKSIDKFQNLYLATLNERTDEPSKIPSW